MAQKPAYTTDIWMKLMIGDFLKETMPLNTANVGAYILLSIQYWTKGPLNDNPGTMAQIAKLSPEGFNEMKETLSQLFDVRDGKWFHAGWDYLRAEAAEYKRKKSEAGKTAANMRWRKDKVVTKDPPGLPDEENE